MINDDIAELIQECGHFSEQKSHRSKIAEALSDLTGNDFARIEAVEAVASGLEVALARHTKSNILLAKMCAHLQRLTGNVKPTRLAIILTGAAPDLVRSLSWMTKLIKAGDILLKWPQLEDVTNIDKLASLWRVPKKIQGEVFGSGTLPDGREFRHLDRVELAAAINALRAGGQVPLNPYREARQKLIRLAADLGPLCESLVHLPGYSAIVEQVQGMQTRLIKIIEETAVVPRVRPNANGFDGSMF